LSVVVAGVLAAQQLPPHFKTAVEAVVLDVSVLDLNRAPVRGLTARDFLVLEDGQPQTIRTFSAVDVPDVVKTTAPWTRTIAPDVRRNDDLADRRLITLVLDDAVAMYADYILWTRRMAKEVISQMGPSDMLSVVFPLDKGSGQDFTMDRTLLTAAVDRFNSGGKGEGRWEGYSWSVLLNTLRGVIENLNALPQQRRALILISSGIPLTPRTPTAAQGFGSGSPGSRENRNADVSVAFKQMEDVFTAARRANVPVYPIDPAGLATPDRNLPPDQAGRDFLIAVGNETGGFAAVDSNDTPGEISRIYRENSSYYVLGYTSPNRRTEGKTRKLEVRVNRPGLTVRTRSGYVEPEPTRRATRSKAPSPSPAWTALAATTPQTDLPLQMVAAPLPALPDRQATVAIVAGVRSQDAASEPVPPPDHVELVVNAYDIRGRLRAGTGLTLATTRRSAVGADVAYEVVGRLKLSPGRYQLRLAASVDGKAGSVYYDLDVPDFAKSPLALSGLVFGAEPAGPTSRQEAASPLAAINSTTVRTFRPTDSATVYARVSQGASTALEEVAANLQIVDAQGVTVADHSDVLAATRFRANRMADISFSLPLSALPPGEYLLTMKVSTGKGVSQRNARFVVAVK
jgi:VWFA-related protein